MNVPDDIEVLYQTASDPRQKLFYLALLLRKNAEEAYEHTQQTGPTDGYSVDYWTGLAEGRIQASKELTNALLALGWIRMDSGNGRAYRVVGEEE
jgi:hypothetical protein